MIRTVLTLALLAATPGLALAQSGAPPARRTTPGPTSDPSMADPATPNPAQPGTAGALLTSPQSAPPALPGTALSPSGAPPDVMMTPK